MTTRTKKDNGDWQQPQLIPAKKGRGRNRATREKGPILSHQLIGNTTVYYETKLRTKKQKIALDSWLAAGCPTRMIRLGQTRSNALTSPGRFSTTWAERAPGLFGRVHVFKLAGDPRNAWRKFKDLL